MLFIADLGGALRRWSEPLGRALGAALVPGRALVELVHPEDHGGVTSGWEQLRQGADRVRIECRILDAEGAYRPISCAARRANGSGAVHGSLREPAVAKVSAEELDRLRQHDKLLRALADNISICVWAIDRNGIFIHHDGKGLATAGFRPGELLGQNIFELYDQEALRGIREGLAGQPVHQITQAYGVDWESWFVPMRGSEQEVTGLIGFTLDISNAKQAERELVAKVEMIESQQRVIRDLATPIIQVWEGVLTLPMIGVVDSVRTSEVMATLLDRIVKSQARFAILDLTGVEMVDTRVAGHLIDLVSAIRLLGAEGVVTGIRPTVAQTMVGLGVDLSRVVTKSDMQSGLAYCIQRMAGGKHRAAGPA